ncbi:MAG: hypothetical protein U0Q11_01600 [Vicinamibacterales bacterium]
MRRCRGNAPPRSRRQIVERESPVRSRTARNRNIRIGMRVCTGWTLGVAVCMVFISLVDWFSSFLMTPV